MGKIDSSKKSSGATPFAQTYFHGTRSDLNVGEFIEVGFNSNYGQRKNAKYIFLSATLDAAIWGAELAFGEERERIYLVEPTGQIEDDRSVFIATIAARWVIEQVAEVIWP